MLSIMFHVIFSFVLLLSLALILHSILVLELHIHLVVMYTGSEPILSPFLNGMNVSGLGDSEIDLGLGGLPLPLLPHLHIHSGSFALISVHQLYQLYVKALKI